MVLSVRRWCPPGIPGRLDELVKEVAELANRLEDPPLTRAQVFDGQPDDGRLTLRSDVRLHEEVAEPGMFERWNGWVTDVGGHERRVAGVFFERAAH